MNIQTKAQIAKLTLALLTLVATLFLLALVVIVVCAGFQINPFKQETTTFLWFAFVGLIGLATMLVLLNVATNISLIADAKIAELKLESNPRLIKKYVIGLCLAVMGIVAFIFVGTSLSQQNELNNVRAKADEVLKENDKSITDIAAALASGQSDDYTRISQICRFLQERRRGLPRVSVIYSGKFEDKPALFQIQSGHRSIVNPEKYDPEYFSCTQDFDCDYLNSFFAGKNVAVMQKFSKEDQNAFCIYIPIVRKDTRFILTFDRRNYYPNYGSFAS